MTYIAKPKLHHKDIPTNALGFTHRDNAHFEAADERRRRARASAERYAERREIRTRSPR